MSSTLPTSIPPVEGDGLAAGARLGAYLIEGLLGEGAMGRVYLARHEQLGRHVALKVLREELLSVRRLVQRFMQEGRIVNQIDHEHIVEVYDFVHEHDPERVYCVMEFLRGETLAQRLATRGVSLESLHSMARQLASALGAAHAVGVVHRDLKPENIFLVSREGRDDWVKVLDFGIAKSVPWAGEVNLVESQAGGLLGTPRYMAPEQVAGLDVDGRTDVYALGTVLYESLAGRPPFEAEPFGQLASDIINHRPPPLPATTARGERVPPELDALVMSCLAKRASERPEMTQFLREEESLLARPLRRPRRPRLGLGAASLLAAGVLTFEPAAPPRAAPPVTPVTVTVSSQPAGALVWRVDTGQPLGRTPFQVALPRSDAGVALAFELPGFVRQEHTVVADQPRQLEATLEANPKRSPLKRRVTHALLDPY
ncbi:MAG: serine/threonine-protein kinase [Archangium sp.]|nr:serine/threonine-protein kinase [Archangium sp.]